MFTKTVYIPFTIESEQEITDRKAQIIANRARPHFINGDLDRDELDDIARANGFVMKEWYLRPAKTAEEIKAAEEEQ